MMFTGGCYIDASLFKKGIDVEAGGDQERTPIYEHAGWTIARATAIRCCSPPDIS